MLPTCTISVYSKLRKLNGFEFHHSFLSTLSFGTTFIGDIYVIVADTPYILIHDIIVLLHT
jgi:hypothetical protein